MFAVFFLVINCKQSTSSCHFTKEPKRVQKHGDNRANEEAVNLKAQKRRGKRTPRFAKINSCTGLHFTSPFRRKTLAQAFQHRERERGEGQRRNGEKKRKRVVQFEGEEEHGNACG
ncbi:UNVERIFIED_CONTAM: hypothetical protein Sindi_0663900 [Sesamum indicum]